MAVRPSYSIDHSGIRPFEVWLQLAEATAVDFEPDQLTVSGQLIADVNSASLGYGVSTPSAQFIVWAEQGLVAPDDLQAPSSAQFWTPQINDRVRIWVAAQDATGGLGPRRVIFQGTIETLFESRDREGLRYTCTATSDSQQLDERFVTLAANNGAAGSVQINPQMSVGEMQVTGRPQTISQLIRGILEFPDAWGSPEPFSYSQVEWNGLENSGRCGNYVPFNVNFQNTPKGQAIEQLLSLAGNFRLLYVPSSISPDLATLVVVEQSLDCENCGNQWDIRFAGADGQSYAHETDVDDDKTQWSIGNAANVVRILSSPVRFYTGDHMVPDRVDIHYPDEDIDRHTQAIENDTVVAQAKRAINQDNAYYRFTDNYRIVPDTRRLRRYAVGIRLYPKWNIFEDWHPVSARVEGAILTSTGWRATDRIEFLGVTNGYNISGGAVAPEHFDHLRTWQAWYSDRECVGCNGTGWVASLYANDENEPLFVEVGPQEQRSLVVKNYRFKPERFGEDATAIGYDPGVGPWVQTLGGEFPVPWKNTCPVCRGTGGQPIYPIRDIQSILVQGQGLQEVDPKTSDGTSVYQDEIPLDTEHTAMLPETIEQAMTRVSVEQGPMIQMEAGITGGNIWLPASFPNRNAPYNDRYALPDDPSTSPGLRQFNDDHGVYEFTHPLVYTRPDGRLRLIDALPVDASAPEAKIVPDNWTIHAPLTRIVPGATTEHTIDNRSGEVVFSVPVFIPAEHYNKLPVTDTTTGRYRLGKNRLLQTQTGDSVGPHGEVLGFWRPPAVWLQAFYLRRGYSRRFTSPALSLPRTVKATTPDGSGTAEYLVHAMMVDGKLAIDVAKANPDSFGTNPGELSNVRARYRVISDDNAVIETHQADLEAAPIPLPNNVNLNAISDAEVEEYKRTVLHLNHPRARMLHFTMFKEHEQTINGVHDPDENEAGVLRPRMFSWRLRDDRRDMILRAIQELETANNLSVRGSLRIYGIDYDQSLGLGWVDSPGRGRATVVRATYSFAGNATVALELSREEMRYGRMNPDDKTIARDMQRRVQDMWHHMNNPDVAASGRVNSLAQGNALAKYMGL
jgi:hypothetical protein